MKTVKNIFVKFLCLAVVGVLGVSSARAAIVDESCDEHDMVRPELALCSTHVYNVSLTENPTDKAEKDFMKDIIAMKTTVITQQMYKQYEQMESMLGRLKTQLKKAILTNDLKVAAGDTGDDDSGSSSYKSADKYTVLKGTNNCNLQSSAASAVSCLQTNTRIVLEAIAAGNTTDARKQLDKDVTTALTWGIVQKNKDEKGNTQDGYANMPDCTNVLKIKKKDGINACAQQLMVQLAKHSDEQNANKMMNTMMQKMFQ